MCNPKNSARWAKSIAFAIVFLSAPIMISATSLYSPKNLQKTDTIAHATPKSETVSAKGENENTTTDSQGITYLLCIISAVMVIGLILVVAQRKKLIGPRPRRQSSADIEKEEPSPCKESPNAVEAQGRPCGTQHADQSEPESQSELSPDPDQPPHHNPIPSAHREFVSSREGWVVVGASVMGKGHIMSNIPCQDSNGYEYLSDGWGIAVVSDGAGSAEHSQFGSAVVVMRALHHFKTLIQTRGWIKSGTLPSDSQWEEDVYFTLKHVHDDLQRAAEVKNYSLRSVFATIIVLIHTPFGVLTCHVGDGRAGYKNMSGEWKTILTPHKGEEANQTVFLSSEFWNIPYFRLSGVRVPESRVIRESASAFVLMSDGCEHSCWLCTQKDMATGTYYDANIPYANLLDGLIASLSSSQSVAASEISEAWKSFLNSNTFRKESDDKTLLLGTLVTDN